MSRQPRRPRARVVRVEPDRFAAGWRLLALLDGVRGWDLDSWGEPKGQIDFTIQGDLPNWVMRITPKV